MVNKSKQSTPYKDYREIIRRIEENKTETKECIVGEHSLGVLAESLTSRNVYDILCCFTSVDEYNKKNSNKMFITLDKIAFNKKNKSIAYILSVTINIKGEDKVYNNILSADTNVENVNDAIDYIYDKVIEIFMDYMSFVY